MIVVRHHPRSFLARAGTLLAKAEAENNLMLGLAISLEAGTMTLSAAPVLATVENNGEVVAAALRTPPYNLLLTRAPDAALEALVAALRHERVSLPGVSGPIDVAGRFAELWAEPASLAMRQRLYACDAVSPVPPASGALRAGEEGDIDIVRDYLMGFQRDINEPADEHKERARALRHLADGTLFVWEDGGVVSMTLAGGATHKGIRVFGVYTPPDKRGRGYATSCVAAVTQRLLDERDFCCLYTDLDNPTSNAIYQRIGYQPVCDCSLWRFTS